MVRPLVVPNPKITMDFNGGVNGWSESHFYTSAVPLSSTTLIADALALATARCAALDGVNAKLFAARLSLDDVSRDSQQVDISGIVPNPTTGYVNGPTPAPAGTWLYQTVQVSWTVVLKTTNPTTNPIEYLAGMPASPTQNGPLPTNSMPTKPAFYLDRYMVVLTGGKWGALGRDFSDPTYPLSNITYLPAAGATPGQLQLTFALPYPTLSAFPIGNYVRLQGATYTSPQKRLRLNGTYVVNDYNNLTGQLLVIVPRILVAPVWGTYGTLQAAEGDVYPYTGYTYRPITHRKRGKPFGGGRGRR